MCVFFFWGGALLEQLPGTKDRIPCALIGFVCASLQGLQAYRHLYAFVRHSRRNYWHYSGQILLLKSSQVLYISFFWVSFLKAFINCALFLGYGHHLANLPSHIRPSCFRAIPEGRTLKPGSKKRNIAKALCVACFEGLNIA